MAKCHDNRYKRKKRRNKERRKIMHDCYKRILAKDIYHVFIANKPTFVPAEENETKGLKEARKHYTTQARNGTLSY